MRPIEPTAGHVMFEGRDITHSSHRGSPGSRRQMQLIFQDPFSSLNPRMRPGDAHRAAALVAIAQRIAAASGSRSCFLASVCEPDQHRAIPHVFRWTEQASSSPARLRRAQADRLRRAGFGARCVDPRADPGSYCTTFSAGWPDLVFISHDLAVVNISPTGSR